MSVKQTLLQQIDNFINELCTIFPKNNDILLFREKYILVKSANSKLVIEYFIQFIYLYWLCFAAQGQIKAHLFDNFIKFLHLSIVKFFIVHHLCFL